MDRVMIVGQPGSGKSTLARRLGQRTGLPVIHIDQIHWLPGWVERSGEEKNRLCNEAANAAHWIFEVGIRNLAWADSSSRHADLAGSARLAQAVAGSSASDRRVG